MISKRSLVPVMHIHPSVRNEIVAIWIMKISEIAFILQK
jgi:hypothetical protein